MAKVGPRENITLKCSICGNETKRTSKNKKNNPDKLELSIYCPVCQKHTKHVEKK